MDNETNNPKSGYHDPELIAAAHGDEGLLARLVALDRAEKLVAADPEDQANVILRDAMRQVVEQRQQELGLAVEPPPSA